MSDPGRPIAEEELHAYVDNMLAADRLPAVLRYLQEHTARNERHCGPRSREWQRNRSRHGFCWNG
jgi:anti-sigma factor RsiW